MSGTLTVERFHEVEAARVAGQVEMRTRIAKWMRETGARCLDERDLRAFAKLYNRMADEIETLDPK